MIYIVYGPPMSGKTTYCKSHVKNGDKLFDYDDVMMELSGRDYQDHDEKYHGEILSVRKRMIYEHDNLNDLYVITTYFSKAIKQELKDKQYQAVKMDADYVTCIRRLNDTDRPDKETIRIRIMQWFDEHYRSYANLKPEYDDEPKKRKFYKSASWERGTRARILERDNYECQICKIEGKVVTDSIKVEGHKKKPTLNVHHVMELEHYPDLAHEDDNLITVCVSCHNRIHNKREFRFIRKPNKWAKDEMW